MRLSRALLAALLCGAPIPAFAQDQLPPPPEGEPAEPAPAEPIAADEQPVALDDADMLAEAEDEEVVVTGTRLRGSVIGNIPPEITLTPRDIRAVGAGSVNELLEALAPQIGSGRGRGGGRPVILVNGRRISSFSEVRDLPPEAISRLEILPEEVALRYGYRADQRVVNLVLRQRFDATTVRVAGAVPTEGGRSLVDGEVNYLQIAGPTRTSVTAQYLTQSSLLESERDIIQSVGAPLGAGEFRTLTPATDTLTLAANHSRMFGNVGATIDGRFVATNTNSLLGLPRDDPGAGVALTRESEVRNAHLGLSLNGDIAPWRWTLTSNFDRVETDTTTERLLGVAPDTASNVNQSFDAQLVANGPVVNLWAGDLTASLQASTEFRSFDSESTRGGVFRETSLSREVFEGQASFDLPITSRREGVLDTIGDLSLNLNLNAQHVSDFGTLTTVGYGLNWRPIPEITVIASVTEEEGAPGINQLGDPVITTPNVRVFDFTRGETVDITRIDGGNPDLLADSRRVINLGITARPIEGLSIRANYTDSRIDNPIVSFPTATAEIEAAFPDRFVRDASGRLVSLDATPINFTSSERRELRWGLNFSSPLGAQRPPPGERRGRFRRGAEGGQQGGQPGGQPGGQQGEAGAPQEGQRPVPPENAGERPPRGEGGDRFGGGRFGGGGRGGFGGGGGGRFGGRLQLGLFHTWRLEDTVLIRPGVPELDFLNGSAAGNNGGTPRHQVELQAGVFLGGFGARTEVRWQSGTTVRGGGGVSDGGDLDFSDLTTVNLRLFANLGQQRDLVRAVPFFRNTRISLDVDNLFDSRVSVTDATGTTPLSYQPFYLDPLGRSVRITLRKQFF